LYSGEKCAKEKYQKSLLLILVENKTLLESIQKFAATNSRTR